MKSAILRITVCCIILLHILGCGGQIWFAEEPGPRLGNESLRQIAYSPDGKLLAAAADTDIRLYDADSLDEIGLLKGENLIRSITFSSDGKLLASGSANYVLLWDVRRQEQVGILKGHEGLVHSAAFSPDSRILASGGSDNAICLWDVQSQKRIGLLKGHTDEVASIAFSVDGTLLASGSVDRTVRLWDVQKQEQLGVLKEHTLPVYSVAFGVDRNLLASASTDNTIRLWDVADQKLVAVLEFSSLEPVFVIFSPDGGILAFSSIDRKIHLWDVRDQKESRLLQGHRHRVRSFAFSPDGETLASSDLGGIVLTWDIGREEKVGSVSIKTAQRGLSRYIGLSIRNLERSERKNLQRTFRKLSGIKVRINYGELRPWWVSEYPDGMTRWILFEAYEGFDIPDRSHVRIHLFDKGWEYLGSSAFETGYEAYLREARLVWKCVVGSYVLEIHETTGWQFYAIIDDRIALIRLEDREHKMVQQSYIREKLWIGPAIPKRTAEQWLQSLDSENSCEVLETLVWLSGRHLSPEEKRATDWAQESVEDSRLVQTVRNSPDLKKKLLILCESPNLWIRQAAELAFTIQTASPH